MSEIIEYKCPCCGGAIEFDSGIQKMKCPYCDTEFEMEAVKKLDEALKAEKQENIKWELDGKEWGEQEADGLRVYVCDSCGGEIIGDETAAACKCPYCDNAVVFSGQLGGDIKPDYVIPFKLDKKAATAAFSKHLTGKKLLPKVFKEQAHIDEIKSIYVPYWLFDGDADAQIRYRATKIRFWSDSNYNYTQTSHYAVQRFGNIGFEKIPVDGSSKMDDALMESIEPFDYSEAKDFQTAYLAGYLADRYDVTAEESVSRANDRIRQSTEEHFKSTVVGYNSVIPENTSVQIENGKARYALFPVWILNTTWNGEKYTFAMNGQTGKFVGNLPLDKKAFRRWFVGIMLGCGAVIYALMWLFTIM
jgi:DNA-directed RNA polymerase subunit RPC12/RpoP